MKYIILKCLFISFAITWLTVFKLNFDNFLQFTTKNFNPPESVARICDWQYVLIKLNTDSMNRVVDYEVLNDFSEDFKSSLTYLKGYQFGKNMPINKRSIVFCLSIINLRIENCDTVGPNHRKLLKGVDKLREYKKTHHLDDRNNIFIYKEVTKQIFDPIN
jgi:hypothetical protein